MNRNAFHSTVLLLALALCAARRAGAEVNQCRDQQGHLTLTDAPCAEMVVPAPEPLAALILRPAPPPLHPVKPNRMLGGDVATLKAAHQQMLLADSMRQRRLAGR
ncbi:MAG: hypothetical protein V4508_01270 [Pseudomonadota bacterium]